MDATEIGRVEIPMATSCDIASDGSAMVILSYFGIYVIEREEALRMAHGKLGSNR